MPNHLIGKTKPYSQLTREEVEEIRWLIKNTNMNNEEIAIEFDVCPFSITAIHSKKFFPDIETPKEAKFYFKVVVKPEWLNSNIFGSRR